MQASMLLLGLLVGLLGHYAVPSHGLIEYDASTRVFHLSGPTSSYVMRVTGEGTRLSPRFLQHVHWGGRVPSSDALSHLLIDNYPTGFDPLNLRNVVQGEYPDFGTGDFRSPAFRVRLSNGTWITPVEYASHRIVAGKPVVDASQPAVYVETAGEAQTLEVLLRDPLTDLEVTLYYTQMEGYDVLTRRAVITSKGGAVLEALHSATVDFPLPQSALGYHMSYLSGAWARERHLITRPLALGTTSIESRRGASSHQHNPFALISDGPYDEDHGEHYAFNLVYSGNFLIEAEVVQNGRVRVNVGINPFNFEWRLKGEGFASPEVVMAFSSSGVGKISRELHRLYRTRLARGYWRDLPRPILVNSWEAMYFDVSEEKIINNLAKPAAELGIELVVLDDGWFGQRNGDSCCLGDWYVNTDKFPNGLGALAQQVNDLGLSFGIWMEPEMISVNSDLYRAHPDWAIHTGERPQTESRKQLVLDLSRPDVRDYIVDAVTKVLSSGNIEYLKWDFNRHLTEVSSEYFPEDQQGEVYHRFVLGLYDIMERITQRFPKVLFESCSGGGGRFDPGMIYYMPQIWTSDNTDAVSRAKIQYGTSIAYPAVVMGAHVSTSPNHQTERSSSLRARSLMALSGTFGYELDLLQLSVQEKATVRMFNSLHSQIEHIVRLGEMYRLFTPFGSGLTAWNFVSPDQKESVAFVFNSDYYEVSWHYPRLRLRGLNPQTNYQVKPFGLDVVPFTLSGQSLMSVGLIVTYFGDSGSIAYILNAV